MLCVDAMWAPWEISRQIVILINVIIVAVFWLFRCCCCCCCCSRIKHIWNIWSWLFANCCAFAVNLSICFKLLINLKPCWGGKSVAVENKKNTKQNVKFHRIRVEIESIFKWFRVISTSTPFSFTNYNRNNNTNIHKSDCNLHIIMHLLLNIEHNYAEA